MAGLQLTNSAIALGIIGLVQAIPRLIFSLVGGVVADAYDRRRLLLIVNTILASLSAILAITTRMGASTSASSTDCIASAIASSFEFPTRQAIIPTLVPREQMADALSISMVLMQLTFVVGSAAGGFVIAWVVWPTPTGSMSFSYFVVLGSLFIMIVPRVPRRSARRLVSAPLDGMRFLRAHPSSSPCSRSISSPHSSAHHARCCPSTPSQSCMWRGGPGGSAGGDLDRRGGASAVDRAHRAHPAAGTRRGGRHHRLGASVSSRSASPPGHCCSLRSSWRARARRTWSAWCCAA